MVCMGLEPGAAIWKVQTNPRAMAAPLPQILTEEHPVTALHFA